MKYTEESYPGGACACPEELRQYFADGTIDGYERVLSEGKEAVVHVVSRSAEGGRKYYAAKVYKKREERGFKNRADYFVMQDMYKRRAMLAVSKKSRFGRAVEEAVWQDREVAYLEELLAAGADVPAVVIDFPQASDPRRNPNAQALLLRDLRNLCAFFAKLGVPADPEALFAEMWDKYRLNEI